MVAGCAGSGLITADALVHSGKCKLVSIHGYNEHASDICIVAIHDNTAASGKVVAKFLLNPLQRDPGTGQAAHSAGSLEFDMHGVLCEKGLYVNVTGGTPNITVEFA
tara:strand:- start:1922 stop:2242 length:321 start_codon:yes stop_codon:yes gene_type:complete